MKFAIGIVGSDEGPDPRELGRAVEAAGFDALFVGDHTHIPVERETPYPMPPYGELPREYYRVRDPLITLASIASVTTTLRLGTGVCLVVERDPIVLAKQVATLDLLSDGRFIFGVGAGWNREEMRNHGTDPRTRMQLLRERVEAMKVIWTREQAAYHGEFVDFEPMYSWPKPVQDPHPPIFVGGNGPAALERVLAFGDGWMPGHQRDLDALGARIDELQKRAAAAGRGPIPVTVFGAQPACLETYAALGVSRALFLIRAGRDDDVLGQIAHYASAAGLADAAAPAAG
jgi:probable F420-dependent oxidoreductase